MLITRTAIGNVLIRSGDDAVELTVREAALAAERLAATVAERLEYLRGEIRAERISYAEVAELQGLADVIDRGDVELLEWAGVPERSEP